jgi:hypothetical protein
MYDTEAVTFMGNGFCVFACQGCSGTEQAGMSYCSGWWNLFFDACNEKSFRHIPETFRHCRIVHASPTLHLFQCRNKRRGKLIHAKYTKAKGLIV